MMPTRPLCAGLPRCLRTILQDEVWIMHYTGTIWRPPYEADSLLLEVTAGCTHHKCKFCTLYSDLPFKFRMTPMEDIERDLLEVQTLRTNYSRMLTRLQGEGTNHSRKSESETQGLGVDPVPCAYSISRFFLCPADRSCPETPAGRRRSE